MYQPPHQQGHYFSSALSQFLHYPHHYIQSLSVSHPSPKSHSLRQGGSCEGDLSELNYTLHPTNYLSDCSQVSLHCCAFRLDLSIGPLFCRTFIIFTQPCALSFINANTHHCFISCRVRDCCTIVRFRICQIITNIYYAKEKSDAALFTLPFTKN